jgi:toxin ParE1/3/4
MPARYDLTPAAKADLRDIWLYTMAQWGEQQAERYLQQLEQCCERLVAHPELGKARDELRVGYRSILEGSHIIIYRSHQNRIEVVRILHRRMDIERHIT